MNEKTRKQSKMAMGTEMAGIMRENKKFKKSSGPIYSRKHYNNN
jgi:hypothetical protein